MTDSLLTGRKVPPVWFEEGSKLQPLSFRIKTSSQSQSRLFRLPREILEMVIIRAVYWREREPKEGEYKGLNQPNDYLGDCPSSVTFLRTCQRAYLEGWRHAWVNFQPRIRLPRVFFGPADYRPLIFLTNLFTGLHVRHENLDINHAKVYLQVDIDNYRLMLQDCLDIPHFNPSRLTLCLQHLDFHDCISHNALWLKSDWVYCTRFPNSVQEVHLEIELVNMERYSLTPEGLDEQPGWKLDIKKEWCFTRKDGVRLFAMDEEEKMTIRHASSIFRDQRFLGYENPDKPGKVELQTRTIIWKPDRSRVIELEQQPAEVVSYCGAVKPTGDNPVLSAGIGMLHSVGITDDVPADIARREIQRARYG